MTETIEDKVTLTRRRAEFVESLATTLPAEERVRLQGELSVVNAQIKALNTTAAAQLKAAADRRKAAGLSEAKANAARARARLDGDGGDIAEEDDSPDQAAAINSWIVAVLRRGDVKVRQKAGALLIEAPARWVAIVEAMCAGLHATARGEALPEVTTSEPKVKRRCK